MQTVRDRADESSRLEQDIVHLARLAMAGRSQDVQSYVTRAARRWRTLRPELAAGLADLARNSPSRLSPLREGIEPASVMHSPVDADSRLELVRHELVDVLEQSPRWSHEVNEELSALKQERLAVAKLELAGLDPTRSALFVGPPGVGKTLAARQLAHDLGLPLLVLDLAAVMSSFLGKTGGNLRQVMDYAKTRPCVLLLDELDAVAKRRDDDSEIGELKRLVTVLLQAIDDWPASGLLLAATNHPDLLDPAVWRRFERVVVFPMPNSDEISGALKQFMDGAEGLDASLLESLGQALGPANYSDVEQVALRLRRRSALNDTSLADEIEGEVIERAGRLTYNRRLDLACTAIRSGRLTQRRASELLSISRDSIRKAMHPTSHNPMSPTDDESMHLSGASSDVRSTRDA